MNLYSRSGKVGNFEFDLNGRFAFDVFALNTGEPKMRTHQILLPARKRLNGPSYCILLRGVLDATDRSLKFRRIRVSRDWNDYFHVVCSGPSFELRLCLDHILHAAVCVTLDYGFDPNQRFHLYLNQKPFFYLYFLV